MKQPIYLSSSIFRSNQSIRSFNPKLLLFLPVAALPTTTGVADVRVDVPIPIPLLRANALPPPPTPPAQMTMPQSNYIVTTRATLPVPSTHSVVDVSLPSTLSTAAARAQERAAAAASGGLIGQKMLQELEDLVAPYTLTLDKMKSASGINGDFVDTLSVQTVSNKIFPATGEGSNFDCGSANWNGI